MAKAPAQTASRKGSRPAKAAGKQVPARERVADIDAVRVKYDKVLFWFRRDLRHTDNAGLYRALKSGTRVYCVFVLDTEILHALDKVDRRVEFILDSLHPLQAALREAGGELIVRHAKAREEIPKLAKALGVNAVFTNEDYEPLAIARDGHVRHDLQLADIAFHAVKDQVVFARDEVLTQAGKPFSVFTPYKNAWLKKLTPFYLRPYPSEDYLKGRLAKPDEKSELPTLQDLGFGKTNFSELKLGTGMEGAADTLDVFLDHIDRYHDARNYPAVRGVSYLSVHNRFGTVSIRKLAKLAHDRRSSGADTWLSELIWRDFYFQILFHFPHSGEMCFKPEYEALKWRNNKEEFKAWCEARTGYPIIDAAMRQINSSGYMHNRLRMIVASFLTKDLLIDWRWGERYFAAHLNDYDLAANAGGWQWAASTGCDAQPYFRIFNPVTQSEKFDPQGKFIRRYLPELAKYPDKFLHAPWTLSPLEQQAAGCVIGKDYPAPIVDHAGARGRALDLFATVRGQEAEAAAAAK